MNIQIEKLNLIQELINIQDESLIIRIKKILNSFKEQSKNNIKAMEIDTFLSKIEESEKAYKNNETITQKELIREINTWRKK